jgi:hypothetical protein
MNTLLNELHQERLSRAKKPIEVAYPIRLKRSSTKVVSQTERVPIADPIREIPKFTEEERVVVEGLQSIIDGFNPKVWANKAKLLGKLKDSDFLSRRKCNDLNMALSYLKGYIGMVRLHESAIEERKKVIIHSPEYAEMETKLTTENPRMQRRSLIARLKKEIIQKDKEIKGHQKRLRQAVISRDYWLGVNKTTLESIPSALEREKSAFFEKISRKTRTELIEQNRATIEEQIEKDPDCPCCLNALEFHTLAIKTVNFGDETVKFRCHNVCIQCAPRCRRCPICRQ